MRLQSKLYLWIAFSIGLALLAPPSSARCETLQSARGENADATAHADLRSFSPTNSEITALLPVPRYPRHRAAKQDTTETALEVRHVLLHRKRWRKRKICRWKNRSRRRRCLAYVKRKRAARARRYRKKRRYRRKRRYRTLRRVRRKHVCRVRCKVPAYRPPADYTSEIAQTISSNNKHGLERGNIKLFAGEKAWGPAVRIKTCFGDNILTKFSVRNLGNTDKIWFQYDVTSKFGTSKRSTKWVMVEPGTIIKGRYINLRAQSGKRSDIISLAVIGSCNNP